MNIQKFRKTVILIIMIFTVLAWTSCSNLNPSTKLPPRNNEQPNLIYKHKPDFFRFNCVSVYKNQVAWVVSDKPDGLTNQIIMWNFPNGKEKVVYRNSESNTQTDELILKSDKELIFCNWKPARNGYYWEINVLNTESNKIKKIASSNDRNSTVILPRLYCDGRYLSWLEVSNEKQASRHTLYVYDFTDNSVKAIASINQIKNPYDFYKIKNGYISWIDKKGSDTLLHIYNLNNNKLLTNFEVGPKARDPISDGIGAVWAEGEPSFEGALFYKNLISGNIINICSKIGNLDWTGSNIVYDKQSNSIELYNINSKTRTTLTSNNDKGRLPSINQDWVIWYQDIDGRDNCFVLYSVKK